MDPKQLSADVVTAKAFVLVDDSNRERASITVPPSGENGAVVLHMSDHVGRPRITLQIDPDGNPSICLFTEGNAPAISLALNAGRGNGLVVGDSEGVPCVEIGIPNAGSSHPLGDSPHVIVRDHNGNVAWSTLDSERGS